jgi:hypothetical protein
MMALFSRIATISFRFWLARDDQPLPRAVEVSASDGIPAFDVAQCDVAGMTQEPTEARSARPVLPRAARMVMIHMDALPRLERLAAHRASVVLRCQNQVELLLGESIARNPGLAVVFLAGLF